jgi:lysozyme
MPLDVCIDISDNNVITDWSAVYTSGIRVAMIKAMDGAGPTYRTWASQSAGARAAGIAVIPYLFMEPMDSAANFIAETGISENSPLALDWEGAADQTATPAVAEAIGTQLSAVTKRVPLGYWGNPGSTPAQPTPAMEGWDRWIPRYPQSPEPANFAELSPGALAKQPPGALFWQYTSSGQVPGIEGPVDRSVFLGTEDELTAWLATGARPS